MAAVSARTLAWLLLILLAACTTDLQGLKDVHAPLVTIQVKITGDLEALRSEEAKKKPAHLRVALVWGQQFASESFCYAQGVLANLPPGLPLPQDPSAAAVYHAGCRDPFGFAFKQLGADVPATVGEVIPIELDTLPSAAVLVGGVDARVGFASLVVYDDRNGNGVLDSLRSGRILERDDRNTSPPGGDAGTTDITPTDTATTGGQDQGGPRGPADLIYGASFLSTTRPEVRIAFREGSWVDSFFYPRPGCAPPPSGYSQLRAGGILFTLDWVSTALEAVAKGGPVALLTLGLPPEPTGTCVQEAVDAEVIEIALQPTETVREVACSVGGGGGGGGGGGTSATGSIRYREPPVQALDLSRPWLCQTAAGGGKGAGKSATPNAELLYAGTAGDCKILAHYVLWGCQGDAYCDAPLDWDLRKTPPTWWPCALPADATKGSP